MGTADGGANEGTDGSVEVEPDGGGGSDVDSGSGADGGSDADGGDGGGTPNGGSDGGVAWRYPGVPYPTEPLPSGIMPALPVPNSQPGWPYDPCTLAAPTPTAAANQYVVSINGNDTTAGNSGRGTIAAPRRTIPEGTFPAGTHIFVYGANSPYGTVDFNMGDASSMTFNCTAAQPCWWVGFNGPRVGRRIDLSGSDHVLFDGLKLVDIPGGGRPFGEMQISDSRYVTLRNVELVGSGVNSAGGSMIRISNVEFLMTYKALLHEGGSWSSNASGLDVHAWRPLYGNRYLWLIDSVIFHIQGDGVQTGNSNNQNAQSASSHYIFIAGNELYENYENALDNKNSYHVVFSSNRVHDFYAAPGASAANGTAIILSNNAEGPWTGYHWALNNRIWRTALAIRDSGSETGEKNYAVGNVIWNATNAFIQQNNALNRESWFIHNSVSGSTVAVDMGQPGSNASLFVRRNVFHNAGTLDTQSGATSVLESNVLFNTTVAGSWDTNTANLTGDPLLSDPANGNMVPQAGSSAIDAVGEDSVFALFQSLYGLNVRQDLAWTTRPQGTAWDIGAIEVP
ncbi:MAG: hypothetical protein ACOZIN_18450 [Myxococcota bacterium]